MKLSIPFMILSVFFAACTHRHPIAEAHWAETPGSIWLYLYTNNECKVTYEGIFGVTDKFDGVYSIANDTVFVHSAGDIAELAGTTISVANHTCTIVQQ